MAQCIHLACKREAWVDPDDPARRSYFCMPHAWKMQLGHLVLTPPQLEIYDQEGFVDCLKSKWDFPKEWLKRHLTGTSRSTPLLEYNQCGRCATPVVSKASYCGSCRRILGLPEDEDKEVLVKCYNQGKELDRECRKLLPISQSRIAPDGYRYCGPCLIHIGSMTPQWRLENGYSWNEH